MARRKSINKRLSRYSRQSIGSAILDPDTNILTEEDPYWWRNLDNNTLARLSVDSNAFNQTSRHLDPNSQVEASQATDGWWKVLDGSTASNKSRTNVDNAKKDAIDSASESESEGESGIAKRKFPFRSKVRRTEGNAFLNVLTDSAQTTATERAQKSMRKDSMNNASSHSRTITNIAEVQKNSSNESHSSHDILKTRPDVFKRNCRTRNANAFVDILEEDKLQSSSRGKSLKIASNHESPIVTEHRVPATAETPTSNQTEPNQFALSFENEHDLSRFPAPKAQSTIIEGGNWSVPGKAEDNSNVENEIVKPRSKLMTRHRTNTKKNLFDNVSEEQEAANEIVKGDLINQNATVGSNISEPTLKQPNNSQAKARNTVVDDKYNRKKIHTLSMSKRNEHMVESAQNLKESTERRLHEQLSSISGDRSNVNRESSNVRKANSGLLTRSRENAEKNRFQDILEEWNDVDTSLSRNSEMSLSREEKEKNAEVENVVSVENRSKRSKIDDGPNRHLSDLHTELLDNSSEGNIPTSAAENDENYNRKTKQSIRSSSESELYDVQDVGNKPSKSAGALERQSSLHDTEAIKSTSTRMTRNTNRRHGQLDSHATENAVDVESPEIQDASKRLRSRSSRLRNSSLLRSMNESESEVAESTPQKGKMNTRRTKVRSDSHAIEKAGEFESSKTQDASKKLRSRSSRLPNNSLLRSMNESESEEAESTPQKEKMNTRRPKVRSDSHAIEKAAEIESPKTQDASKRIHTRSSKLQNYSSMRSMNESELEEAASTPQKDKRNTRRTKERTDSHVIEKSAEIESPKTQDASKGLRTRSSKLQNYSLMRSMNESESEEAESTPQKDQRNTRRTKERFDSHVIEKAAEVQSPRTQDVSKRQRTRTSKLQNYSMMPSANESDLEKAADTPRRNKRSKSGIKEQSSSHAVEKAAEVQSPRTQDVSKRQRTRTSKLQNYSMMPSTNESELKKAEDTPRRNKRSVSRVKERSNSPITRPVELSEAESAEKGFSKASKRQSDRQGTSHKHSHLSIIQKETDPLVSEEDESAEALDVPTRHRERLSNERTYLSPESTTRRSIRSLSRTQKRSTLPAPEEAESTQTQYTPAKQIDLRSKSQKYSRSRITNDHESSKTQSPSRRSNRNLSRGRVEQSVSPAARKTKRSGAQTVPQKRSEVFTDTQSYLTLPNQTEHESERVENATQNTMPPVRTLNPNVQKGQQSIKSFFSTDKTLPASQAFSDKEKVEKIKRELERVKECEMARMKQDQQNQGAKPLSLREKLMNKRGMNKKVTSQKQRSNKPVHKAFLVNGQVYKAPRLPRPQRWITDRLYKYLWKRMKPKCKLETRVASEKFVQQLSNVTTVIIKRKSYIHYKTELHALMKEMARLDIIKSRNDFYNFCHDFFPYELRIKTVPMLLPGNKRNIPYDADKLHEPLLSP